LSRGVIILQDNARPHTSNVAMAAIRECGFELIPHPAYSPDLAPSDYYLFGSLKNFLRGQIFNNDNEIKSAIEGWFQEKTSDFFLAGIEQLPKRWHKCIEVRGDYIEY